MIIPLEEDMILRIREIFYINRGKLLNLWNENMLNKEQFEECDKVLHNWETQMYKKYQTHFQTNGNDFRLNRWIK